jgi:uncharacterized protein YndB with AHSA1/START domain
VSAKPSLSITRRINASPEKVYAAWTDAKKMMRWWRPWQTDTVHVEADVRIGGRFRVVTRAADGEPHEVTGSYRQIVPNEKLVFSWAWKSTPERESLVTIDLKRDGRQTVLTLTHEQFHDEPARDRHREGWNMILDKLDADLIGQT